VLLGYLWLHLVMPAWVVMMDSGVSPVKHLQFVVGYLMLGNTAYGEGERLLHIRTI